MTPPEALKILLAMYTSEPGSLAYPSDGEISDAFDVLDTLVHEAP